jgi:flagellar protein FliS
MDHERVLNYRETQIKTASQGQLIVLLYDGLIRFLDIAMENLPDRKYDVVNEYILKAQDIVTELSVSLNMEAGELSTKLMNLYSFMNMKLIEGNMQKTPEPLNFVRKMAVDLRDAWIKAAKSCPADSNEGRKEGGINLEG